ncbi:hypothetical protein ACH5RR_039139 [Cinchona calisaya]|uniref:Uncharacterized protein n=1 Tax=Cinchona calisaya TaxID=153742 RepID=A0ABD2XXC8_9GENT
MFSNQIPSLWDLNSKFDPPGIVENHQPSWELLKLHLATTRASGTNIGAAKATTFSLAITRTWLDLRGYGIERRQGWKKERELGGWVGGGGVAKGGCGILSRIELTNGSVHPRIDPDQFVSAPGLDQTTSILQQANLACSTYIITWECSNISSTTLTDDECLKGDSCWYQSTNHADMIEDGALMKTKVLVSFVFNLGSIESDVQVGFALSA